ncbi:MAG: hypothetical protein Q7T55_13130 [Solirubrobacteraceae bacterium]|nr:hypothetical protein [Solirubrobacteraceae bacterium]
MLESEVAAELKRFRKSMKAARMLPDYTNPDIFPPSRSGAWEIFHEKRDVEGTTLLYVIYVRRSSDQLAVNENGGHPYVLTSNFTQEFPWAPPTADDLRQGMVARMRALGVQAQ